MPTFSVLLLSLPFSGVGIEMGGVFFSSGFIAYLLFISMSLKHLSLTRMSPAGLGLILFLFACVLSNVFKNSIGSFIGPFLVLCYLTSIFFVGVHRKISPQQLYRSLKISYQVLIVTIFLEVIFYFVYGLNPAIYSSLGIHGSSIEYNGIPRLRGFQLEPSILSYVAIFYLIAFNLLSKTHAVGLMYRYSPVLVVMTTMASSGFLFLICGGVALFLGKRSLGFMSVKSLSFLSVLVLIVSLSPSLSQNFFKVFERIFGIYDVILASNYSGSVGYRVHSLIEPIRFYSEGNFVSLMSGTGFSNYKSYIIDKYQHLEYSGFASGDLNSILSAVAISTGILGLLPFGGFIYFAYRSKETFIRENISILFVLFLLLSYGNMMAPFVWIILFSLFCLKRIVRNNLGHTN